MNYCKHINRNLTAGLLLMLFSLVIANSVCYFHVHVLPDGSKISHAHPYQKNKELPGKQHQHSSSEIVIIEQSSNYVVSDILSDIVVFRNFNFILHSCKEVKYDSEILLNFRQRAPPFFVI